MKPLIGFLQFSETSHLIRVKISHKSTLMGKNVAYETTNDFKEAFDTLKKELNMTTTKTLRRAVNQECSTQFFVMQVTTQVALPS